MTSKMSCDTFVVLPPLTKNGNVIFGKNADRPHKEAQEIIYRPAEIHAPGSTVQESHKKTLMSPNVGLFLGRQCTYIKVEQVGCTHPVVLSKPCWMWGAEMGANDRGVCIGNEAVSTKLESEQDREKKLLGMDLVRLGLERASTAKEALDVITALLDKHGQGGPCSDYVDDLTYHNSFLICDPVEAYVLETAKDVWAAQRIKEGYRNISNCLSIGTDVEVTSAGLEERARQLGFWNGDGPLHFADTFGAAGCPRYQAGADLLRSATAGRAFDVADMFTILRDEESGICMRDGPFVSASSQVSVLSSRRPSVHWLTGTTDPKVSVFKPFVFTAAPSTGPLVVGGDGDVDVDVEPPLRRLHRRAVAERTPALQTLAGLEERCRADVDAFLDQTERDGGGVADLSELDHLFRDCAETEAKFYG